MALASSSRVGTYYVAESSYAVTPTNPNIQTLRRTAGGDGLVRTQTTVVSEEIDASRTVPDQIETGYSANFGFSLEVSAGGAYDDFMTAVLCGAAVTATITGTTISFANGDNSINDSGNGFVSAGFIAKQWVRISGTTNNDGVGLISTVAAGKIVLATLLKSTGATTVTTESAGGTFTLKSKTVRTGTATQTSFSIEEQFSDLTNTYQRGIGFRPVEFTYTAQARQKLSGSMRFLGNNVSTQTSSMKGSGSILAADSAAVLNATSNVPAIYENGSAIATRVRNIGITCNGNVTEAEAIANAAAAALIDGTFTVSGPFEAYFEDTSLITKVLNHTSTSLYFPFKDGASPPNWLIFSAHKAYLTGQLRKQGQNQPVLQGLTWTGVRDTTTGNSQFQVDMIHA